MRAGLCAAALALSACAAKPQPTLEGGRLALLYATLEERYLEDQKFRTDYDPADAPYDSDTLTRDFVTVAQRSETQTDRTSVLIEGKSIPLSRWAKPIRLWAVGANVQDREHLADLQERLSRLIGLPMADARTAEDANIYMLIAGPRERRAMVETLSDLGREDDAPMMTAWPKLAEYPCIARVFVDPETNAVEWAMIFVKAELSGAFRRSCLTEELVQSLGLFNDGDDVRPSIFNDDAEFIELTRHDEYLLQILYDPRLKPGMTREVAEPIARRIAEELLADRET